MESLYQTASYGVFSPKVKTNRQSVNLYICVLIFYSISLYTAVFIYKGNFILSIYSLIYWMVATLPLILTKCNWIHPLMYQMIFEIPKVLSFACRSTGYVALDYKWHVMVTREECIQSYIFCVVITCIGLLIEYLIVFNFHIATKKKKVWVKKTPTVNLLLLFSMIAFFCLVERLGGLSFIFENYQKRLSEFGTNTSMYLRNFTYYGVVCLFYFYLTGNKKKTFVVAIIQIFIFVTLGERGGLITAVALPFFIVYQLKNNKRIKTYKVIIGAVLLLFIYLLFGAFRAGNSTAYFGSIFKQILDTFSSIEHFVIASELLFLVKEHRVEYLFGRPLLNIFVAPFPRRYFPWKPPYIADSIVVGDIILRGSGRKVFGLPPGTFAYGYLNFGIIGVVLFAAMSGIAIKWLYDGFIRPYWGKTDIPNGNILIYVLLVQYICDILSTEVQIKLILYGAGLVFVVLFSKLKKRRESEN